MIRVNFSKFKKAIKLGGQNAKKLAVLKDKYVLLQGKKGDTFIMVSSTDGFRMSEYKLSVNIPLNVKISALIEFSVLSNVLAQIDSKTKEIAIYDYNDKFWLDWSQGTEPTKHHIRMMPNLLKYNADFLEINIPNLTYDCDVSWQAILLIDDIIKGFRNHFKASDLKKMGMFLFFDSKDSVTSLYIQDKQNDEVVKICAFAAKLLIPGVIATINPSYFYHTITKTPKGDCTIKFLITSNREKCFYNYVMVASASGDCKTLIAPMEVSQRKAKKAIGEYWNQVTKGDIKNDNN
jgi:hypothetical protein